MFCGFHGSIVLSDSVKRPMLILWIYANDNLEAVLQHKGLNDDATNSPFFLRRRRRLKKPKTGDRIAAISRLVPGAGLEPARP
ncbi:MAG: hypothetical protein OSA78_02570 [Flavobacteriales bacterium]|nr:hypothetical protein [Flavobacteriales bacterium]